MTASPYHGCTARVVAPSDKQSRPKGTAGFRPGRNQLGGPALSGVAWGCDVATEGLRNAADDLFLLVFLEL